MLSSTGKEGSRKEWDSPWTGLVRGGVHDMDGHFLTLGLYTYQRRNARLRTPRIHANV